MATVLDFLLARYPTAKRQTLKRMAEDGRITVNGVTVKRLKHPLGETDDVRVNESPRKQEPPGELKPPFEIVYEDADLLVVNKPPGLLTSTNAREKRPTLLAMVRDYAARRDPRARIGLIHRLDRDAAGLLIFSKNPAAYESLKRQFFDHTVDRIYTAVVRGVPAQKQGRIESRLYERADGVVRSTRQHHKGQHAITEYEVIKEGDGTAMLRVRLETGRKHQIRVHLSQRGWPIVGDAVYGKGETGRLMLFATALGVEHPRTGNKVRWELPVPKELDHAMVGCR
jgi:23S rRNA pseudouridine1911/1915/1917 synthase